MGSSMSSPTEPSNFDIIKKTPRKKGKKYHNWTRHPAKEYCSKHADCYGDTCMKRCRNNDVKKHCVSVRIDGVMFWNHKLNSHCKTLDSCKSNIKVMKTDKRSSNNTLNRENVIGESSSQGALRMQKRKNKQQVT